MAEIATFIAAALPRPRHPGDPGRDPRRGRRALRPLPGLPLTRRRPSLRMSPGSPRSLEDRRWRLVGSRAVPSTGDYLIIGAVAGRDDVRRDAAGVGASPGGGAGCTSPTSARCTPAPIPAIGGLAMYVGFLVALATARLLDRFDPLFARNSEPAGVVAGGDDHHRRRAVRRHQGPLGAGQGHRHRRRRAGARVVRRDDVLLPAAVPRRVRALRRLDPARHRAVAARHDPGDQPDRRPRRPRRRHRRHRRLRLLPLQPAAEHARPAPRAEHRAADGDHRRRRCASGSCRTTSTRRASSWATAARCCSAC